MKIKGVIIPDGLRDLTYQFIKGIINVFDKEQKLNSLDSLSLYILAGNFDNYLECEEQIKKNGLVTISDRGNESLSPYAIQQQKLQSSIITILKEMGLTLGSRSKIKAIDSNDETSPLLAFLNR